MKQFNLLLVLLGSVLGADDTQLVEVCKHASSRAIHLALNDEKPRAIEDWCPKETCHISQAEHTACLNKNVVMDLVQTTGKEYVVEDAEKAFTFYMSGRGSADGQYLFDGINLKIIQTGDSINTFLGRIKEKRDAVVAGTKKPYLSLTVKETISWAEFEPTLEAAKPDHVVVSVTKAPTCGVGAGETVLCGLMKNPDQIFMLNIEDYSTKSHDFHAMATDLKVNDILNFKGFVGSPKDVSIDVNTSLKVVSVQCEKVKGTPS